MVIIKKEGLASGLIIIVILAIIGYNYIQTETQLDYEQDCKNNFGTLTPTMNGDTVCIKRLPDMLNFEYNNSTIVGIHDTPNVNTVNARSFRSYDQVETVAKLANQFVGSDAFMAIDGGHGTWPRYDVIKKPKIGDIVQSYDTQYKDEGNIVSISPTLTTVKTSSGKTFNRIRMSSLWRSKDGKFMVYKS